MRNNPPLEEGSSAIEGAAQGERDACPSIEPRTKKVAVTLALQEFIARRQQKRVLDLMGKLKWDTPYDYKTERSRE